MWRCRNTKSPDVPQRYASTLTLNGYGRGVLATCYSGRPTKLEGNPDHPASLGASDVFMQAAILQLYDPDRSASIRFQGRPAAAPICSTCCWICVPS